MTEFTLQLLQAINDWQRGGDHKQKVKRGAKLKQLAAGLPEKFRTCSATCYRQEAHEKDRIWQLLADSALPETIAAWTIKPNAEGLAFFDQLCRQANIPETGAWWLSEEGTKNVLAQMEPQIERLRLLKS